MASLYNFGATSGSVLKAMPLSLYSRDRHQVPIIQMNGWTAGPFRTDMENFALNICATCNFVYYLPHLTHNSSVTPPKLL